MNTLKRLTFPVWLPIAVAYMMLLAGCFLGWRLFVEKVLGRDD